MTTSPPARLRFLLPAAVAILTAAVFWGATRGGFVLMDDDLYVTGNSRVLSGLTREGVRWAFTSVVAGIWHPLTILSHMAAVEIFGVRPWGHHATNVLLHACNAALLLGILRRATGSVPRSLLATALFALHPLRVESVAWIAERKDPLSLLLSLLAIGAYCGYVRRPGWARYLTVLALFCLALLAKPMMVTLPVLLLLLDGWPFHRLGARRGSLRRCLVEKLPMLAASGVVGLVAIVAQARGGGIQTLGSWPLPTRAGNALVSSIRYLWKSIWPFDLAVFYPLPAGGWGAAPVAASALLVLAATCAAVAARRRRPFLTVGWFWYLAALAPVIGIIQVGSQAMADRYTYLPSIGTSVAAAWIVPGGANRLARRLIPALAALLVAAFAGLTVRQIGFWRNDVSLFSHSVAAVPDSWLSYSSLGVAFERSGNAAEAERLYRHAIALAPEIPEMHHNLGNLLAAAGRSTEAAESYRRALSVRPSFAESHYGLANLLAAEGHAEEARAHYEAAIRIDPDFAAALTNLGNLLLSRGEPDAAISLFTRAVSADPGLSQASLSLGAALDRVGRPAEAVAAYRRYLSARPDAVQVRYRLAIDLVRLGDRPSAAQELALLRRQNPAVAAELERAMTRAQGSSGTSGPRP